MIIDEKPAKNNTTDWWADRIKKLLEDQKPAWKLLESNYKNLTHVETRTITESRNKDGVFFGQERLLDFINKLDPNQDSIEQLKKEVLEFTGGELEDDLSVIAMKLL